METATAEKVKSRDQIDAKYKWDMAAMYADDVAFEKDLVEMLAIVEELAAMKGTLTSWQRLAEFFKREDRCERIGSKLRVYADQRSDEDTENTECQARKNRMRAKWTEAISRLAWMRPELLALPAETLQSWADREELAPYRKVLRDLVRDKPHTLSAPEETLLSQAGEIFAAPYETFSLFSHADLKFPAAIDAKGGSHEVTHGRLISMLQSTDRVLRKSTFEKYMGAYTQFRNTVSTTLSSNLKVNNYLARARHFPGALEAALHPFNLPREIYLTLIESVHAALPDFHKYLDLRRRTLGLDTLDMWDLHIPIIPDYKMEIPFEQGVEWAREAMAPMGPEYAEAVEECFTKCWIDVYENRGKRSGGYSSGCYDSMPYILLNYQNTLDDVFTLVHELGHSVHTWLANKHQSSRNANYSIFVAEIASITAEMLLLDHLYKKTDDVRLKAYLLNHLCDSFRGTVFRQTMFAEFEHKVYQADAAGTPMTADWLCDEYYALNATYHGSDIKADNRIGLEWARIPHFYFNFYVFQYATGFCAAQIFSKQILSGAEGRERYLDMLRGGGSMDPLELVQRGGVDLADRGVLLRAFESFRNATGELRGLLGQLSASNGTKSGRA